MSRVKRLGLSLAFAAIIAGGVVVSTPAQALTLPSPACAKLAEGIEVLTKLAMQYPDNPLIAFLLERAKAAQAAYCS